MPHYTSQPQHQETRKEDVPIKQKWPKVVFAAKMLLVIVVIWGVVKICDNSKLFEPHLTFHEKLMKKSLAKFVKQDTIDILFLGNSIVGAGINCHYLSNELGCNAYTYFTSGSDVRDAYFTLNDFLSFQTPKVVVVETFTIGNILSTGKPLTSKAVGFSLRSDTLKKILSMPYLFGPEEYWGAWSTTIRNHDFIFRDTAQLQKNRGWKEETFKKGTYLGDGIQREPCINDSLDALYDSLGPMIDGAKLALHDYDQEYINKIKTLCDKNNIKLIFLTVPLYKKHIVNYNQWQKQLASVIEPTGCPWIDLQKNYDKHYTKEFFEKKRQVNQHMTYRGSMFVTNQFAFYLRDSLKLEIADRTKNPHWHDMFANSEGYLENFSPRANDTVNHTISDNETFGKYIIRNAYFNKNAHCIFVRFDTKNIKDLENVNKIELIIKGIYQGKEVIGNVKINKNEEQPFNYPFYWGSVIKKFTPTSINVLHFKDDPE